MTLYHKVTCFLAPKCKVLVEYVAVAHYEDELLPSFLQRRNGGQTFQYRLVFDDTLRTVNLVKSDGLAHTSNPV